MNSIKCPHCGTVFTINETEYSQLLAQVRSQEFDKEIHDRLEKEKALLEEKSKNDLQTQVSAKDKEIAELNTQLEQAKQALALENQRQLSEKEQEIAALKAQLDNVASVKDLELKQSLSEKDKEVADLKAQLENVTSVKDLELTQALNEKDKEVLDLKNQLERLALENKTSLVEAVASVEKERDEAQSQLALQEKEAELSLASKVTTKPNSRQPMSRSNFTRISKRNNPPRLSEKAWKSMPKQNSTRCALLPFQMLPLARTMRYHQAAVPKGISFTAKQTRMVLKYYLSCSR